MSTARHPDPDLLALGIRQPWAELILRGVKTVEVRSQDTNVRGPIYVYASKKFADIAPADSAIKTHGLDRETLTTGMIVGTVEIIDSRPCRKTDAAGSCIPASYLKGRHGWMLANPVPFDEPIKVRFLPYGIWFYPFKRRKSSRQR